MKVLFFISIVVITLIGCEKEPPPLTKGDKRQISRDVRYCLKDLKIEEDSLCKIRFTSRKNDLDSLMDIKRTFINEKINKTQNQIK